MVVKEIPEKTESKKASAKKKKTMEKQNKREKKF
jgi:hypothetical protein